MSRRAPGWAVEAVAWAAGIVLLAGATVVGSGVITEQVRRAEVLAGEAPVLVTSQGARPPQPPARLGPAVHLASAPVVLQQEPSLGPPPGPGHDIAPARVAPPEKRFALLVGVTHYQAPTHHTLAGARDVAFIRAFLLANGWLPQNIRLLSDEKATGSAMRAGLDWLAARSVPGSFTLFHYSGHVLLSDGHERLWSVDNQFLANNAVAAVLGRGRGKMWIDIAGCEAGGFMEDLPSARVLVTTSSKSSQKSYEHPVWGESVWVGLLWDAGLAQGQADLNHDGVTTVGEAIRFAAYWAQAVTLHQEPHGRQTPQAAGDPVRGWTLAAPPA